MNPSARHEQIVNEWIGLVTILVFIITGVFYCLSQQRALAAVQANNRRIAPGLVWLQFIPFLGQIWQVFVIYFIADSFRAEFESHRDDSLLGIDAEAVEHFGKRPTLALGIVFFVSWMALIGFNLWYSPNSELGAEYFVLNFIPLTLALTSIVFFVIYWVRLIRTRRSILNKSAA
jgi:hypothetical protein